MIPPYKYISPNFFAKRGDRIFDAENEESQHDAEVFSTCRLAEVTFMLFNEATSPEDAPWRFAYAVMASELFYAGMLSEGMYYDIIRILQPEYFWEEFIISDPIGRKVFAERRDKVGPS